MDPQDPNAVEPTLPQMNTPRGSSKMKYLLLAVFLLLVIGAGAMLLSNSAKNMPQTARETTSVSPTIEPLTKENADATLSTADQNIQSALDQSDTDLQDEAKVDSSQDTTSGL